MMVPASPASQTLVRGLDVLEQVADGPIALNAIARQLGLSRSTVHRLAATLLERRYLNMTPRRGYSLGPKLLELGFQARDQISVIGLARPYLEALALLAGDVALLAMRESDDAVVADQAAGGRRVLPSLRIGDRFALGCSALGKALTAPALSTPALTAQPDAVVVDDVENDIRIIAGPVRGADGRVRAAIGVATAAVYADAGQQTEAAAAIREAARALSAELGWRAAGAHAKPAAEFAEAIDAAQRQDIGIDGRTDSVIDDRERDRMGVPKA